MAQFVRPAADTVVGDWGTAPLWSKLDEAVASDADFISSPTNPNGTVTTIDGSSANDPNSSSGHVLRWRASRNSTGGTAVTVTLQLWQIGGVAAIASRELSPAGTTWVQDTYTLSSAEADAITDYGALEFRLFATGGGGSPSNRRAGRISWIELEVPDATEAHSGSGTTAVTFAPTGTGRKAGAGSATMPLTTSISASGRKQAFVTGSTAVAFEGIANGIKAALGSGTITVTFAATGTGSGAVAEEKSGSGSASVAFTLTATGTTGRNGVGSTTLSTNVTSAGHKSAAGAGTAATTYEVTGTGIKSTVGAGTLSLTFTPTGTGIKAASGMGSTAVTFAATGLGNGEAGEEYAGSGSTSVTFAMTATGRTNRLGTGGATATFAATGAGLTQRSGLGLTSVTFGGTAVGTTQRSGSGSTSATFTATGNSIRLLLFRTERTFLRASPTLTRRVRGSVSMGLKRSPLSRIRTGRLRRRIDKG